MDEVFFNFLLEAFSVLIQFAVLLLMYGTFKQNQEVTNITMEAAQTTIDATKVEEKARLQRSHEFLLTSRTLSELGKSISEPTLFYKESWINARTLKVSVSKMTISWSSVRSELLLNHMKTGYPDLLKSIYDYEESYNKKGQKFNELLKEGTELLKLNLTNQRSFFDSATSFEQFCFNIMNEFRGNFVGRIINEYEFEDQPTINQGRFGWEQPSVIFKEEMNQDAVIKDVIHTFDSQRDYYKKLFELASESKLSRKDFEKIQYELESIKESVMAGSRLEGWCEEGVLAGYEKKESDS